MTENHSDVTATAVGLTRPIASALVRGLDADLSQADGLRIGEAFVEVLMAGMRVGAAEIIAGVTEHVSQHGVTLDVHVHVVNTADEDEQT
jgi:hypothetical protein